MAKVTKNYKKASEAIEPRRYVMGEALAALQKIKFAKFDETVELHMRLGVDPRHADQMVRGNGCTSERSREVQDRLRDRFRRKDA